MWTRLGQVRTLSYSCPNAVLTLRAERETLRRSLRDGVWENYLCCGGKRWT